MNPIVDAVRQKYPGAYDDLSDDELTRALGEKYGEAYADVPEFANDWKRLRMPEPAKPPGDQPQGERGSWFGLGPAEGAEFAKSIQEINAADDGTGDKPLVDLELVPWQLRAAAKLGVPGAETTEKLAQAVSNPAEKMAEGMTSPKGIAMLPTLAVPWLGGPLFAAMAAKELPALTKQTYDAIIKGDVFGAIEAAGDTLLTGAVAGLGGLGVFHKLPPVKPPVVKGAPLETPTPRTDAVAPKPPVVPEIVPESRQLTGPSIKLPEKMPPPAGPDVIPPERQLTGPAQAMPDAVKTTEAEILTHGAEAGEAIRRIQLPIEPESAKAARQVWERPKLDPEVQAEGIDALKQLIKFADEQKTPGKPYEPPSLSVDLQQLEKVLKKNTVSKVESWADQAIQDRLRGTSANPFLDPEFVGAVLVKGTLLFKRGVVKFAEWSDEMRKQFGRGMEEQLPVLYKQSKDYWETRERRASGAQPPLVPEAQAKVDLVNRTLVEQAGENHGASVYHDAAEVQTGPGGSFGVAAKFQDGKVKINAAFADDAKLVAGDIREEFGHRDLATPKGQELLSNFIKERALQAAEIHTEMLREGYFPKNGEVFDAYNRRIHDEFIAKQARPEMGKLMDLADRFVIAVKEAFGIDLSREQAARAILRELRKYGTEQPGVRGAGTLPSGADRQSLRPVSEEPFPYDLKAVEKEIEKTTGRFQQPAGANPLDRLAPDQRAKAIGELRYLNGQRDLLDSWRKNPPTPESIDATWARVQKDHDYLRSRAPSWAAEEANWLETIPNDQRQSIMHQLRYLDGQVDVLDAYEAQVRGGRQSLRPLPENEHALQLEREQRAKLQRVTLPPEEKVKAAAVTKKHKLKTGLVEDAIKAVRAEFPKSEGWDSDALKVAKIEVVKKEGKPDAVNVTMKGVDYSFNKDPKTGQDTKATHDARVNKISGKLTEDILSVYKRAQAGDANAKVIMRQAGWYRNMAVLLRHEFGGAADLFADLLGAFSPNTQVDTNWNFGIRALQRTSRGEFDHILEPFSKWIESGKGATAWKDAHPDQMIVQPNGKMFGMNSEKGMLALVNYWRMIKEGTAPKARNFALNLIGQSLKATVDVWAARSLQRLAGETRLPTAVEKALTGKHGVASRGHKVSGSFGFGQEVFEQSAKALRESGIKEFADTSPADLQAMVWFREKELWGSKGWTTAQGEGGSFEYTHAREAMSRYVGGTSQARPKFTPTAAQQATFAGKMHKALVEMPGIIAARVMDSLGVMKGKQERSFDLELTTGPDFDPAGLLEQQRKAMVAGKQDTSFVSRVVDVAESNPNARPGVEVYFKTSQDFEAAQGVIKELLDAGGDGLTMVVDPRTKATGGQPNSFIGVRFQWIPEYAGETAWRQLVLDKDVQMADLAKRLRDLPGVAAASKVNYDTTILSRNDPRAAAGGVDPTSGEAAWLERANRARSEKSAARAEILERERVVRQERTESLSKRREALEEEEAGPRVDDPDRESLRRLPNDRPAQPRPAPQGERPPVIPTPPGSKSQVDPSFRPEALSTPRERTLGAASSPVGSLDIPRDFEAFRKKWFVTGGNMPKEAAEGLRRVAGVKAAVDFSIKKREADLMGALKETYGLSAMDMAGGGSRRIPAQAVQLMDDYIHGRVANGAAIPAPVRGVLDTMRAEIEAGSAKVIDTLTVEMGKQKPGSVKEKNIRDLIDKIRGNMDVYVHRAYRFFDSKAGPAEWYRDLNAGVRMRAEDYLIQNAPPGMTRPQAESLLLDWLNDLKGEGGALGGGTQGAKDLSIFMKRGVIAPEMRAVLGEYHNPVINYAKSVSKMADFVAKQKFLNDVKRQGMGVWLFEEGANPPGFNTQIAGEGSSPMSPLNGLRTSEPIAEAFKNLDAATDYGALAKTYMTLNAWSKFAATGLSALTQVRNLISRPSMALMAGHYDVTKLGRSLRAIYEDFAGNNKAWEAYQKRAYQLGVIGDSARGGELMAILKDAALNGGPANDIFHWSLASAIKKYGYKIPAEIYRLSDELGNIYGWENEKAIQAKIHPQWSAAQVEAEAAKVVKSIYPTYSDTPRAVQEFRKVAIFGPFVTFPYQMYRTTVNALGRSLHEIRSSNPTERAIGAKRLGGQVAALSGAWALQEMGKSLLGINSQQEDDFRRFMPPWAQNNKYLFTGKGDGKLSAINLSYLDPYSYLTDPLVAIMAATRSNRPVPEVAMQAAKEMLRPFVTPQMLATAIHEAYNGKTDMGRDIWTKTDSQTDKTIAVVNHIANVLKPGTVQRAEKRIIPAFKNEQPLYGRKLEPGPEVVRELTGLAIEKFDFRNGLAFRAREFTNLDKDAENVFHKMISRTQTTTAADLAQAYREADARRFVIWREMRKDFLAAVRQGVPVQEAKQIMRARGLTQKDASHISLGRYDPMPISDSSRARARERNRQLPMEELRAFRFEAKQRGLDDVP